MDDRDAVGAANVLQPLPHGVGQVAPIVLGEQMWQDLAVGLAAKLHALLLQQLAQGRMVLDDPVVHHGQAAGRIRVRMGVLVRRAAVGGPAGVGNAQGAFLAVPAGQLRLEFHNVADRLDYAHLLAAMNGHARRVVTAVLQTLEPLDQNRLGLPLAKVCDNTAHRQSP